MKSFKVLALALALGMMSMSAPSLFSQQKRSAYSDRTPMEIIELLTDNFMRDNPLVHGEYSKGDWAAVINSSKAQLPSWLYPTGVTLWAMQDVYNINHNPKLLEYVEDYSKVAADQYAYLRWQAMKFGKIHEKGALWALFRLDLPQDYAVQIAAMLECKMEHGMELSDNLNELIGITTNQMINIQYRLDDGTFWRPNSPEGPTLWADELIVTVPMLIRLAKYHNDSHLLDDAIHQVISYASYMQEADGVWKHGYFINEDQPSCCKWGRANGWVAMSIADLLSNIPADHPQRDQVFQIYKSHIDGIIKLQADDGLWHQVLDHPELAWGTETSCSAQFTFAIARGINRGWLDASYIPVVKRSLQGFSDYSRISKDGKMLRVCPSTSIGFDLEYYNTLIPEKDGQTDHHGDGLIIMALTEMHTLLENLK